jgi:YbbR domain-containing protein
MIAFLRHLFLHDSVLKLFSLALAILTWLTISIAIRKESPSVTPFVPHAAQQATFILPVMVLSSADTPRNVSVEPKEVQVTVEGDAKRIQTLQRSELKAIVDLTGIEAAHDLVKRIELSRPASVNEVRVVPAEVKVIIPPKS